MLERIPWAKPFSFPEEVEFVTEAIQSNWISEGSWLTRFEQEFSEIHEGRTALAVSNGTTALQLALLAMGILPQDEVIVPNFSFAAPGNMTIACGARPVFVDVSTSHWNTSVEFLEKALSPRSKAVIYVHNYGVTGPIASVADWCAKKGLFLIEDVAEACFSKQDGRFAGTFGDVGCFSFQATKTITTGEGGMVLVKDDDLVEDMRLYRSHGMTGARRYWHLRVGHNFRLTNLQAAFGCAQLKNLPWILSERSRLYRRYVDLLSDDDRIEFQEINSGCEPVMWAFGIKIKDVDESARDALRQKMADVGIETRPGFYPYSKMPLYNQYCGKERLQNSEHLHARIILLPFYPGLTDVQVDYVCEQLLNLLSS